MTSARVENHQYPGKGLWVKIASWPLSRIWLIAREESVLAVAVVVVAVLALYQLSGYPRTWFDEGMYLQTAKNLVTSHTYAVRSADGTLDYAPAVGVGPTLILPVAAVFSLWSISLEAARLVPVLYLLIATILMYVVAKALFGRLTATLTLFFLLGLPALDWIATGRQVLGEIPAVVFLLAGGVVAYGTRSRLTPLFAGMLLGLAMITKGQYALIVPVTIVLLAVIDKVFLHRRSIRWFFWMLTSLMVTYAIWMFSLLLIIGGRDLSSSYRQLRVASGGALFIFNLSRSEAAVRLLVGPSSLLMVVPALIAGLWWIYRSQDEQRERLIALWLFQGIWMFWFVTASIGWARYAFPALTLSTILMAALTAAVIRVGLEFRKVDGRDRRVRIIAGVVATGLLALLTVGVVHELVPITRPGDSTAQMFASAVEKATSPDATIAGWEPEIGFLLNRKIQYPPPSTLNQVVAQEWTSSATKVDLSSQLSSTYLIVGPFARWVGVYSTAVTDGQYRPILQVGDYELFRISGSGQATINDGGTP